MKEDKPIVDPTSIDGERRASRIHVVSIEGWKLVRRAECYGMSAKYVG